LGPEALWDRHADYAFAVSPRGAGLDCHRTWEALVLRTIPIVKHSTLLPVYGGFPVAVVRDWTEVTPKAMAAWRAALSDRFTACMFRRLTAAHWTARILEAALQARAGGPG
jgi:hypothetical protein